MSLHLAVSPPTRERQSSHHSVVLPFNNLGGEPANEYFAAGLTDER